MRVTMRAARASDREFCRDTHHAAYRDVVLRQFGEWDEVRQDRFFADAWKPGVHEIVMADGADAGYCCVERRPDDIHVRELVIHPSFQNRGIGTALLEQWNTEATARAVPVRLGTFHENRAVELYRRLGFAEIERTPTHILMERGPQPEAGCHGETPG